MATTVWLCCLAASSIFAQDTSKDDPLIFDKRLSEWMRLLTDETPKVRWTAAQSLGRIGRPANAALPALVEALKDKHTYVRKSAARALPRIGPQAKDVSLLIASFKSQLGANERGGVAEALGQIGPEAKDALSALKEWPGIWSAYAIVQIDSNDETGVPYLVEKLDSFEDQHITTQTAILRALGSIGPRAKAALPTLKKLMLDKDQYQRMKVAYAVARIESGNKFAFSLLLTSLKDRRHERNAAQMLGSMGPEAKAAVPSLLEALNDFTRLGRFREYIFDALGDIGSEDALPTLRLWLNDFEQHNREAVALAIYKIERGSGEFP